MVRGLRGTWEGGSAGAGGCQVKLGACRVRCLKVVVVQPVDDRAFSASLGELLVAYHSVELR